MQKHAPPLCFFPTDQLGSHHPNTAAHEPQPAASPTLIPSHPGVASVTGTAVAYAASVAEGLRRSVDGDKSYSGLMTNNPLHTDWDAHWITDELHTLDELAAWLDSIGVLPPKSWRRTRRKNPVRLGRNCYIFETARTWAYREIRHHFDDPEELACAISCHLHELNAGFADPSPLPKQSRSPAQSRGGSSPSSACGVTAQPSTKPTSSTSNPHADAKADAHPAKAIEHKQSRSGAKHEHRTRTPQNRLRPISQTRTHCTRASRKARYAPSHRPKMDLCTQRSFPRTRR
ncbi:replication initiation protein [Corynebacterium choanae]|uniref:replication initiation protein n=1 Tax=Corynebacterium choanae TaxID=1862358 RepID=UPI00360E896E